MTHDMSLSDGAASPPSDWTIERLAAISDIRISNVDKKSYPREQPVRLCNYMDVYGNDYIRGRLEFMEATATPVEIARFGVERGDVLATKDSETPDDIGVPAVVTEDIPNLVCGYHLAQIKPDLDSVDSVFLSKQISEERVIRWFGRLANGSTRYGLSTGSFENLEVWLPRLPEQRKIARILTTLDELIEKTEALIAKYQAIKQGMMHDLFTRGIDQHGHLRPTYDEAPELYKESELGWIPKAWRASPLCELYATPIRDFGSFSSTNLITFLNSGIPFIKSEMIGVGNINWGSVTHISDKVHLLLDKSHVRKGNILFSKIGSALGKAVVYDGSRGECNSNAAIAKIDIAPKKAGTFFVTYFLNHDTAQMQFKNMIVSLLPRINLGDINRLIVPVPSLPEQKGIENRLLAIDTALTSEQIRLNKHRTFKTGLMQDLLTGKVRVRVGGKCNDD